MPPDENEEAEMKLRNQIKEEKEKLEKIEKSERDREKRETEIHERKNQKTAE